MLKKMSRIYWGIKKITRFLILFLNGIAGVPNYELYLKHFVENYPIKIPLSEKEFYKRAHDDKYGGAGIKRCC